MSKIGIIGAMDLEVDQLKEEMTVKNITRKANMDFYEGTLNGAEVVIVRCGIGNYFNTVSTRNRGGCVY